MRNFQRRTIRIQHQRPVWRDPRFIIGFIMIFVSIVAVSGLVSQARAGTQLYYVTQDIAPGESLTTKNTAITNARIDTDVYLRADEELAGRTVPRALRAGELIPRHFAQADAESTMRTFVITVGDGLPEDTHVGTELELWFTPNARLGAEATQTPQSVTHKVYLVKIIGNTGTIGSSAGTRIEVRSNSDGIQQILAYAQGNGTLSAVPVGQK